ncbi:MAG: thiol:disulfide interchange protein DsbA/DsbL [Gammaproteobacteria bacterium]|jgi:thiol:disulfide interchange protein DsbA|nr:thiol:disulfide interchange protein DsbA/DsbL [Gammaproteobacteria bacterium]
MKSSLLAILLTILLSAMAAAATETPAGFRQVEEATSVPNPARVEVIDFFWYGCPYCNLFEPQLESWLANKPTNVDFIRIPAVIRPGWSNLARAYYTAETLGILDPLHERLFAAIHKEDQDLEDIDTLAELFTAQGIDRARFEEAYTSSEVDRKVQEAAVLTRRYGVDSVPAIVVNGQYRTDPVLAGGASRILDAVNAFIASEQHHERSTKTGSD